MLPALPTGLPRRLLIAALAAAVLALLIAAPSAFADAFTPESGGSQNADDIDTLYKITLYIGIAIFLLVEGTLLWSLIRYRARRGGPAAAQIRGNTPLELGWTVGAALILVVLTVVTFVYLPDIENPPPSGPNGLRAARSRRSTSPTRPRAAARPSPSRSPASNTSGATTIPASRRCSPTRRWSCRSPPRWCSRSPGPT